MSLLDHIPYGRENAVTRPDLRLLTGLSDRRIRRDIEDYRTTWRLSRPFICSSPRARGYWLTEDIGEIERFRREYGSYQSTQGRILGNLDMELAKAKGDAVIPVRAHFRRVRRKQVS